MTSQTYLKISSFWLRRPKDDVQSASLLPFMPLSSINCLSQGRVERRGTFCIVDQGCHPLLRNFMISANPALRLTRYRQAV